MRKSIPRGASAPEEEAIEKKTTGACWPWNLSTVPTATPSGSRSVSSRTCALNGATTITSPTSIGRATLAVRPRLREQALDLGADRGRFLLGRGRVALVLDRQLAHAGADGGRLPFAAGGRVEPALVERDGDVLADVGVHPPRALEEEPHVLGDRVTRLAEEVLEHRAARVLRVDALAHLRELHRVAEQHDRPRARAERERVGERCLARLVDEQVVELPVELRRA